jgi:phage portal protein BeeE
LPVLFPNGTQSRDGAVFTRDQPPGTQRRTHDEIAWEAVNRLFSSSQMTGTYAPKEAYALSPWMAPAINAFAGTVAARTFRVMERKKVLDEHWLLDLIARPNRMLRTSEYALLYYTAALWRYDGEVFWELEYGSDPKKKPGDRRSVKAQPTAIWLWHRGCVTPALDSRTREFLGWEINFEGARKFVDRLDMLHLPQFDPTKFNPLGPSRGTSIWQAKRLAMTNEIRAQRWNTEWWSRGIAPSVAFVNKDGNAVGDSPEAEEQFLAKVKAKVAGKNGEPMLFLGDWVIQQLEASQRDAQFIEGMDQNRKAILAGNTPPIAMGDNEANYANANAQIKAWLSFDVIPALSFFASCIDVTFIYDEPRIWTDFSTDDIDELQEGKAARVERYVSLIQARHSPKVAAQIAGIDVDPSMPGYDQVFLSFSQIPYEYAVEGQSVSVSKDDDPMGADAVPAQQAAARPKPVGQAAADEPTPPAAAAKNVEPAQRTLRIAVPTDPTPTRIVKPMSSRAADRADDKILRVILEIVGKDTKKLRDKSRTYQLRAFQVGTEQVGNALGLEKFLPIDNPRVIAFLEERGNLITSVPEGVANRIFAKTTGLIEKGTTPEDIGTIIRKDFNVLSDFKARQIGRQEVGSALNGGRHLQMVEEGVDGREWLSSKDARVRDSHVSVDGEVVEGVDAKYSNGLRYPQDPEGDASETINCRCIELPAVGGGQRAARCAAHLRAIGALAIREAAAQNETIDERAGYWRAVVLAKDVRAIERQMASAISSVINGWRAPILKALAELGVAK